MPAQEPKKKTLVYGERSDLKRLKLKKKNLLMICFMMYGLFLNYVSTSHVCLV